jgi:hypothetical protein
MRQQAVLDSTQIYQFRAKAPWSAAVLRRFSTRAMMTTRLLPWFLTSTEVGDISDAQKNQRFLDFARNDRGYE